MIIRAGVAQSLGEFGDLFVVEHLRKPSSLIVD